jgi:hypothetical protein
LNVRRHWRSFHNAWATYIASDLNRQLPAGYFAKANVQFGIEIDVAAFEEVMAEGKETRDAASALSSPGSAAMWTVPAPTCSIPFSVLTAFAEVLVYNQAAGPTLLDAIELVSPANKDRPAQREAFVSKCASYLQQGIGLIIVDVDDRIVDATFPIPANSQEEIVILFTIHDQRTVLGCDHHFRTARTLFTTTITGDSTIANKNAIFDLGPK